MRNAETACVPTDTPSFTPVQSLTGVPLTPLNVDTPSQVSVHSSTGVSSQDDGHGSQSSHDCDRGTRELEAKKAQSDEDRHGPHQPGGSSDVE